jgi:hypothetical protein
MRGEKEFGTVPAVPDVTLLDCEADEDGGGLGVRLLVVTPDLLMAAGVGVGGDIEGGERGVIVTSSAAVAPNASPPLGSSPWRGSPCRARGL